MIDLTARQVRILRAIIEEFIETAEPVGSDTIDKKFGIGVSPATIRNEMVYLTQQGYLSKGHSSSGRMPTPVALKLYVNELMKEKDLSVADEVSAKEKIWSSRDNREDLLIQATRVLADRSHALGLAMTADRHLYHAGYSNLLSMPEFYDIDVVRHVLSLIEEASLLEEIFDTGTSENVIHLVYGPELGNRHLQPIGMIFMRVETPVLNCTMGVLGSTRFEYDYVIPLMRYFRSAMQEMVTNTLQ
jgi:heat-inducible transcriptional repressor